MDLLSASDLRLVVEVSSSISELRTLAEFRAGVLTQISRLIPNEVAGYNEVVPGGEDAFVLLDPPDSAPPDAGEVLARFGLQNPLIARYHETRDACTLMWSDFVSASEFHRTEIYDLLYRPMGVEDQIACQLPAGTSRIVGLAVNRPRRNLTERDRAVLDLARPAIVNAYCGVRERALFQAALGAITAPEGRPAAVITLSPLGTVEDATPEAQRWLERRRDNDDPETVPGALVAWLAERRRSRSSGHTTLTDPDEPVSVRFVAAGADGLDALVVEWPTALSSEHLRTLGLTPREAEVLRLVEAGLSNRGIGAQLGTSGATVAKHLQRIYTKLGVSSRTAAVHRARESPASTDEGFPIDGG